MLSLTFRPVSSSAIARASGTERARRSSLLTTSVSPLAYRRQCLAQARTLTVGAAQSVIDIDPLGVDTPGG